MRRIPGKSHERYPWRQVMRVAAFLSICLLAQIVASETANDEGDIGARMPQRVNERSETRSSIDPLLMRRADVVLMALLVPVAVTYFASIVSKNSGR